jgi:hypothetical protein
MTSPEPVPAPVAPFALIVTTEGSTLSATDRTSHALGDEGPDGVLDEESDERPAA